jgi:hypothetical protein
MTERERARQIERALQRIDEALADIESAAYRTDLHPDDDDDLWWAYWGFTEAYHEALETPRYGLNGEHTPSPLRQLKQAVRARL